MFPVRNDLYVWREWWRYFAAMSAGGAVNYVTYFASIVTLQCVAFLPVYAVAIGSLAGMAINFLTAKFLVFGR
jgi:putative flippase GtrA